MHLFPTSMKMAGEKKKKNQDEQNDLAFSWLKTNSEPGVLDLVIICGIITFKALGLLPYPSVTPMGGFQMGKHQNHPGFLHTIHYPCTRVRLRWCITGVPQTALEGIHMLSTAALSTSLNTCLIVLRDSSALIFHLLSSCSTLRCSFCKIPS